MPALVDGDTIVLTGTVGNLWWDDCFTAGDVAAALAQVGRDEDVTIRLNSAGGIATEGAAIHAAIAGHRGRTTVIVEGIAASAASALAMAADEVVTARGALMMVHDPSGLTLGTVADHEAQIRSLTALATAMAGIYADKTGRPVAEMRAEMQAETWMTPEEAVAKGYADRALARGDNDNEPDPVEPTAFDFRLYQHPPATLVALADRRAWSGRSPATATAPSAATRQKEQTMPNTPAGDGPAQPTNVVDIDAARAEGRTAALAYVREVRDLCALAGKPEMADAFIEKEAKPGDVRKELLEARASADGARDVSTQTLPGAGAAPAAGERPDGSKTMLSSMEREIARAGLKKEG